MRIRRPELHIKGREIGFERLNDCSDLFMELLDQSAALSAMSRLSTPGACMIRDKDACIRNEFRLGFAAPWRRSSSAQEKPLRVANGLNYTVKNQSKSNVSC
jgi:hypothetical protein